ncbi:hypothetical protein KPG71_19305 [Roseovarius sp. PS-C2]|uniref:cytochrome-c peroxidase n=1 Tax=Roseovarius sp. PS-C2 TaxID=2820814 RepID=UPI001C0C0FAD|nr:hypothetical protein [Roseovarius sp. PS-C2]
MIVIGGVAALQPDLDNPADLRQIYSGSSGNWPAPWIDPGVAYIELAAPDLPTRPAPNSQAAKRRALGERLFNDPILSASGHVACQSCHNRRLGWGDGLPRSFGHARTEGRRNAPALFAAARRTPLFWDGRAQTLKEQALFPLADPTEMANHDLGDVADRLQNTLEYPALFADAYGFETISLERIADAIATFQRYLDVPSQFDHFLQGQHDALSDTEIRGLHLFRTKARCVNCHFGPDLSDGEFHNLGLAYFDRKYQDLGRYEVTGNSNDAGKFLTPSLRHVSRTAPYMHNGLFPSLRGIINLYVAGGARQGDLSKVSPALERNAKTHSPHLKPLTLTPEEIREIEAFLRAL